MNVRTIYQVFEDAFTGYFVTFEKKPEIHINRWLSMGVDFELSYGVKSGGQLVAFVLHAPRKDMVMNLATGVRRDFQGQGITSHLYDRILKDLPLRGFRKMQLEVITENVRAIKAYEKAGFKIQRKLLCWKGSADSIPDSPGTHAIKKVLLTDEHAALTPFPYAFEMDKTAVEKQQDMLELHELREGKTLLAYAVWNPWKMNLIQLGGKNKEAVAGILSRMKLPGENFGMVNVDEKNDLVNGVFRDLGLVNYISQYEMETEF
ncbi:MAG: GNAT family N-acetyltransferase [Bdellovibrionota bacterium]